MQTLRRKLCQTLVLLLLAAGGIGSNCTPQPIPRPPGDEGSARWAYAIAQPQLAAYAPDTELRQILALLVEIDGRLPSNRGSWGFVGYSPSRGKIVQANVSFDGSVSTDERDSAAPGPGAVRPLSGAWANSTAVLQATNGHRDPGATVVQLIGLNLASYPSAPSQSVWAINFNAGSNQLVKLDGTYIGTQ